MIKNFLVIFFFVFSQHFISGSGDQNCPKRKLPNEIAEKGGKAVIVIEEKKAENEGECACKKWPCVCCEKGDPENWFVKSEPPKQMDCCKKKSMTETYPCDEIDYLECCEELRKLKERLKVTERQKKGRIQGLCRKKDNSTFPCPRQLLCPSWKICNGSSVFHLPKLKPINISTECTQCMVQLNEDQNGVIIKCRQCNPFQTKDGCKKENPTKLLLRKGNIFLARAKFLQTNEIETSNKSLLQILKDKCRCAR